MNPRILILGAGFGGLELATILSGELGADADITLIDRAAGFVPGSAAIDLLFGRIGLNDVETGYRLVRKPGVRFLQEEIVSIDPETRRVTTTDTVHECDLMVVALGTGYDLDATPGLAAHGSNFYSPTEAAALAGDIATFRDGQVVVGVCDPLVKCPPAPSACVLLLAEEFDRRGVSESCGVTLVTPAPAPVPPSPEASAALVTEFERAGVAFLPNRKIATIEADRVTLADGDELPCDLFLAVPKLRVPAAIERSGMTDSTGYIPVDAATLATRHEGVYAIGDAAATAAPKAGVFAEDGARTVAAGLIHAIRGEGERPAYAGQGSCYVEVGQGRVSRIDVTTYPMKSDRFNPPAPGLAVEKGEFGPARQRRWFGA